MYVCERHDERWGNEDLSRWDSWAEGETWNTECRAVAASDAEVVAAGEAIAAFVCR